MNSISMIDTPVYCFLLSYIPLPYKIRGIHSPLIHSHLYVFSATGSGLQPLIDVRSIAQSSSYLARRHEAAEQKEVPRRVPARRAGICR
jgi:hypothetical protein